MNYGVVYKVKPDKKINGTLFYCFEYFIFLKKFVDIKFYLVDVTCSDFELIKKILKEKYTADVIDVIPITKIDLYFKRLDKTIIFDVMTFYDCKELLTNEIHCYSNDTHEMYRYKNDRTVIYYGSYDYQNYDIFSYLKCNFEIFKPLTQQGNSVFISSPDLIYIMNHLDEYKEKFQKPVILKQGRSGVGNLFDLVDSVHYIHTGLDKNNRIIPESFYYNKPITIENLCNIKDSVILRYADILENGLKNYVLTEDDEMVKACLRY